PKNIEELKDNTRKYTRNISIAMLGHVFQSFRKRLQFCAHFDEQHFENI
ncbi:hypothetical protein EAI_05817, partial [Harpegnathos saltator]